jgi:hypothetical protein
LTAPVFAASIASANRSTSGPYGTSGAHRFCEWCLPFIPSFGGVSPFRRPWSWSLKLLREAGDPVAKAPFSATCRGSAAAATWTAWTTTVTLFRAEWSRLPWARSWKIHLTPLKKTTIVKLEYKARSNTWRVVFFVPSHWRALCQTAQAPPKSASSFQNIPWKLRAGQERLNKNQKTAVSQV